MLLLLGVLVLGAPSPPILFKLSTELPVAVVLNPKLSYSGSPISDVGGSLLQLCLGLLGTVT